MKVNGHLGVVAHTFNQEAERQADLYEFKVNLVYRVSSRTTKATQRNPVLKEREKKGVRKDILLNTQKSQAGS